MTLECFADSPLGDIPNLECQKSSMLKICPENDDDGDNDHQRNSRTYSDCPIHSPGCEKLAVWAETYAANAHAHSFMDQATV